MIDSPSSSNVTVTIGNSVTLSCISRGSPPDTFTWMKDGTPAPLTPTLTTVTHNTTTAIFRSDYNISNVTTSDSGTYTCTVTNPIGSDSEKISVAVTGELILLYASTLLANVNGSEVKQSTTLLLFCSLGSISLKKFANALVSKLYVHKLYLPSVRGNLLMLLEVHLFYLCLKN